MYSLSVPQVSVNSWEQTCAGVARAVPHLAFPRCTYTSTNRSGLISCGIRYFPARYHSTTGNQGRDQSIYIVITITLNSHVDPTPGADAGPASLTPALRRRRRWANGGVDSVDRITSSEHMRTRGD